ncbi:MAG: chromate transporter [Spirochaetes bacterium]|nr:chromate transporter [Spirochaetota bacterium]
MIYLELFGVFLKIGLFGFGGGYAMVPLLEGEIASHGWLPVREFADIVAISQMTPGPIMVNAATYIGYRVAGVLGSAVATFGVSLPSFILVVLVAHSIRMFKESLAVQGTLSGIRPGTIGLIAGAVVFFARMSMLHQPELPIFRGSIGLDWVGLPGITVVLPAVGIFLAILIGSRTFGLKPIPAVILSAVLGIVFL